MSGARPQRSGGGGGVRRDTKQRRLASVAVLIASCIAILATTPGPPTQTAESSGDVSVGPTAPAEIVVRYGISEAAATGAEGIQIRFMWESGFLDRRLSMTSSAVIDAQTFAGSGFAVEVPPAVCRGGCTIQATARVSWNGPAEDSLRIGWDSELEITYDSLVPASPLTATVVSGTAPPIRRVGWFAIGILGAVLVAAACARGGTRLRRVRLALAAAALLPAAWLLWWSLAVIAAPYSWAFGDALEALAVAAGAAVAAASLAYGLWRALRGNATALRVAGWVAAVVVGFFTWIGVMASLSYRPHEVVLLTLGLGVPIGAAITAVAPGAEPPTRTGTVSAGTAIVVAAQLLMFGLVLLVCGYLAVALVVGGGSAVRGDLGSIAFGVVPFLVLTAFIAGLRSWRHGHRRWLAIANIPVALAVLVAGAWSIVQPEDGFLAISIELKVFSSLAILVVLVGVIGMWLVTPPLVSPDSAPTDDQGDKERGQRDEVARIPDEGDGDDLGDRS